MAPNTERSVCPPIDGSLTLPETLAFHDAHNADVPLYVYSEDGQDGLTEISYGQFARACRRVPQVLRLSSEPSTKSVVAVMAFADTMVYQATLVGLMNAGYVPFPISPRNSAQAIANLLQKVNCYHLRATRSTLQALLCNVVEEFRTIGLGHILTVEEMPTIFQLFPELSDTPDHHDSLIYNSNVDGKSCLDDIAMYIHSSGSTGLPKAVPKTHRELLEFVTFPAPLFFRDRTPRIRMACMHLPPYHALGMICQIFLPLFSGISAALYPPTVKQSTMMPMLSTPDNILEHIRRTKSNALTAIPTLLQVWAQSQDSIDILSSMIQVRFSGGPLSHKIGKLLVSHGVKLKTSYGGTEFGAPAASSLREGDEHDWEYVEFSNKTNIRWVPQGDGTYECQCLTCDTHHVSFENLSDVRGYATSDIFLPHSTKSHLWKIVGRLDDVIVHSSGEKTVPLPMENIFLSSPHISGAVMFGHGHDQPGVLVEPSATHQVDISNVEQVAQFRNLLWPVIEEANQIAPGFSRVFKELIMIVDKNKPLPRAGKGTVMRKAALNLFAKEIEMLYASIELAEAVESIDPPSAWDKAHITPWLLGQASDLHPDRPIITSENLFEQGFDSLSATILRRRITGALQSNEADKGASVLRSIDQNTIYNYPTIDSLVTRILELLADPNSTAHTKNHVEAIEDMITKYSFTSAINVSDKLEEKRGNGITVLLTGSTGYLGSQLLENLLRDTRVLKIYVLNRPSASGISSAERHLRRFRDKALDEKLLELQKLVHLESDCGENNLGLPEPIYDELSKTVNAIIHTAWKLDFNLSLASFESNIRGTHNLIDFARKSVFAPDMKFIFASSVGVGQSWDTSKGLYPEEILSDAKYAVGQGYGESKYVVERILATSSLNATSLRIGQISGSQTNGAWSTTDWVPILIKSSLTLRVLPSANGNIVWIPVNAVSDFIQELVFQSQRYSPAYNVVNSSTTRWNTIMEYINTSLRSECQSSLSLIPYRQWFEVLEQRCTYASIEAINNIPAIKLRDYFKRLSDGDLLATSPDSHTFGATEFATSKATDVSQMLASLPPLNRDDISRWVAYWNHSDYLIR